MLHHSKDQTNILTQGSNRMQSSDIQKHVVIKDWLGGLKN